MIFLDTNVVIYLYVKEESRFSATARAALNQSKQRLVSPFVRLELAFLVEKRKVMVSGKEMLDYLARAATLKESETLLAAVVSAAQALSWTRDPFDRLIVAEAMVYDAPLLTSDRHILQHYAKAVW